MRVGLLLVTSACETELIAGSGQLLKLIVGVVTRRLDCIGNLIGLESQLEFAIGALDSLVVRQRMTGNTVDAFSIGGFGVELGGFIFGGIGRMALQADRVFAFQFYPFFGWVAYHLTIKSCVDRIIKR